MSLFSRWFGKRPPPKPHPGAPPTQAEESREPHEKLAGSPPATTLVPPGHKVEMVGMPDSPGLLVKRLEGGPCLAFLGCGSDEPVEALQSLLRQIEPLLAAPGSPTRIALGENKLSGLFAPADPPVTSTPRFLVWIFSRAGLDGWLDDPARLQVLLSRLYQLEHSAQPLTQCVYFDHDCGPGAAVMARLLAGLGLRVRQLEADPQRILLLQVHRPEGFIITGMAGRPFPLEGAVDDFPATVNAEKARAQAQGDAPRIQHLEQRERDSLARVIQPIQSQLHRVPLLQASRLRRLLQATVDQGGPTARRALEQELLERKNPLLLLMEPDGQSTPVAEFPGIGQALRAYPDLIFLQRTVKDLEMPEGSYRIASLPVRDLFDWGAKQNISVGINLYLTPYTPTYVFWTPEQARRVAQGQLSS